MAENLWEVVVVPALVASSAWLPKIYQYFFHKADDESQRIMTAAERREKAVVAEQETLTKERKENLLWVEAQRDRAEADLEKARLRRIELEKDLERGWGLARFYYRLGSELYFEVSNVRFNYDALCLKHDEPLIVWKKFDFPTNFESPIPKE